MKKTLLKLTAIITMLCAFSGCDALLSSLMNGEQEEPEKEQPDSQKEKDDNGGEETKLPTSLADLTGTSFIYTEDPNWMNVYVYVKDSKTLTFVSNNPKNEDSKYNSSDSEVDEAGRFLSDATTRFYSMKIIDGRLFFYYSSSAYEIEDEGKDSWACEKDDKSEGLIGSWMYLEDWPYSTKYVVTEDKITQYSVDKEEGTTEKEWSKTYTLKNGLLLDSDNNIIAYYDGINLHTEGITELTKITDAAKAEKIKKAALGDDYVDDDEGGEEPETIEDLVGTYFQEEYLDAYFYLKDASTVVLFDVNSEEAYEETLNDGKFKIQIFTYKFTGGKCIAYRDSIKVATKQDVTGEYLGTWFASDPINGIYTYTVIFTEDKVSIIDNDEETTRDYKYTYKDGLFHLENGDDEMYLYLENDNLYLDTCIVNSAKPEEIKPTILNAINDKAGSGENQGGEETKVPTSLADLVGSAFIMEENPNYLNYYLYVKDANTIVTCAKDNFNGKWWTGENELEDNGYFYSCFDHMGRKIKVAAGKFIILGASVSNREKDRYEAWKVDGTDGLYGFWEWANPGYENYVLTTFKITEDTFSEFECDGYENWDKYSSWAETKSYKLNDGLLIGDDGEIIAYYDTALHTYGVEELTKVTDEAVLATIKKSTLDPSEEWRILE
ncbi:MAG: hypothetical protein K6A43_03360 [Treponema sp.]|nr:hypothetical protein [Treponema sp.]